MRWPPPKPWFTPGERHTYHTNTYGHLVGELVHRVGGADARRGAPVAGRAARRRRLVRRSDRRAASLRRRDLGPGDRSRPSNRPTSPQLTGDLALNAFAHFNPPGYSSVGVVEHARWRSAQIGSTSGHGSANGIARIYAALTEPDRLLSSDLLREADASQSTGPARCSAKTSPSGSASRPRPPVARFGPNPRSFGHFGTGGALGFADPDTGIGFGYVMNHVIPRWQSSRNRALIDAVYASI